jgi:hypothetical protein
MKMRTRRRWSCRACHVYYTKVRAQHRRPIMIVASFWSLYGTIEHTANITKCADCWCVI